MLLKELIDGLGLRVVAGSPEQPITEITDDSRAVKPGCLFIARSGYKTDGHDYVRDALERGATSVVTDGKLAHTEGQSDSPIAWVQAEKPVDNALLALLAERFFGYPSDKLKLVGVTGTNGKTTTVLIVQHLLAKAGVKAGIIGTIVIDDGATRSESNLTTPGAIELSRILAAMVRNGCAAAVMETSSHALHQNRTGALRFSVAAFTNLTGDHLDYHGTMENYAAAKAVLFERLLPGATAVINAEDPWAARMISGTSAKVLGCAIDQKQKAIASEKAPKQVQSLTQPAVRATLRGLHAGSSDALFEGPWGAAQVRLPFVGRHNVMNALQAAACAHAVSPLSADLLIQAFSDCPAPPGRLEPVTVSKPGPMSVPSSNATQLPTVLVDYAHTHDALQNVLQALRPLTKGKLITLFGCGGDRDRTKRPKMAKVACDLSDLVVVTSDNPRTEDPQAIITEILTGVPENARNKVTVEPDRAKAIARTIAAASPDDVVLLAGKGHENYQIIGTTKRHFDDRLEAAQALSQRLRGAPSQPVGA